MKKTGRVNIFLSLKCKEMTITSVSRDLHLKIRHNWEIIPTKLTKYLERLMTTIPPSRD